MFILTKPDRQWSDIGIVVLIGSIIASIVLSLFEGYVRSNLTASMEGQAMMLSIWATDFRFLAEQGVYASTIFIVGAKFIETRSILTIGFDKLDASRIKLNGPDENNVVWIGHRYGTPLEAQAVADTFAERLKQSSS